MEPRPRPAQLAHQPLTEPVSRYAQRSTVNPARRKRSRPALRITQRCSYGGILSPCLANIALSALDEHFAEVWETTMASNEDRVRRRRRGLPMYRPVRYADLSGDPDKSAYAESRVMPSGARDRPWLLGMECDSSA